MSYYPHTGYPEPIGLDHDVLLAVGVELEFGNQCCSNVRDGDYTLIWIADLIAEDIPHT